MKTITRYSAVSGKTLTGGDYAYMREDERGFYVAMHDHVSEMELARARIRELESAIHKDISSSLHESLKALNENFREDISNTVVDLFKEMCSEPKKSADPCKSLAVQFSNDLTKATQTYGRGWRSGGIASWSYVKSISGKLECIASSEGNNCFTKGKLYGFSESLGKILITNDDFVSGFNNDDGWVAKCCGITINEKGFANDVYHVSTLSGKVIARFVRA